MAKKPRKHLATDLKPEDVILLDRPEVKVLSIKPASKKFRQAPKGSLVIEIEDKATGKKDEIFVLDEDKIDVVKRLSRWDKFKNWLDNNHLSYGKKAKAVETTDKSVIPPLMVKS